MNTWVARAALMAAVPVLVGCGSSSSGSPAATRDFHNAQDVASALGLGGCQADTNVVSDDALDCNLSGGDMDRVNWFSTSEHLDTWTKMAKAAAEQMGGTGPILIGSNWSVECATKASCSDDQAKIGGKILA